MGEGEEMKKYKVWNYGMCGATLLVWLGMTGLYLYESNSRSLLEIWRNSPGNILRTLFLFLLIQYFTPGILLLVSVKQDGQHDRTAAITFSAIALGVALFLVPAGRVISCIARIEVPYLSHAYYGHAVLAVLALAQLIWLLCNKIK